MAYSSGALAVRYVGGQRRFLVPTFMNKDLKTGKIFSDLVEWAEPSAAPYTGTDPNQAPTLVETRRWSNWTLIEGTPAWQEPNAGVRIGGLYWDESQGVLWYQLYAYYSGRNHPFLGATRLLDTTATGNYRTVGPKYGPWWYRDNNPADTSNLYWKAACNWIVPVPQDSQADLKGNKIILGGTVGAVGGAGHLGPGFRAIPSLPPLTDAPNTVIPIGLRLVDYSRESTQNPSHAHRTPNYTHDNKPPKQSGLLPPNGTFGYWQMSLDQVNSFIWVQTPTKEGILLFGRQATGLTWYGFNPRSTDPGWVPGPVDALDPTRPNPDTNGYGATAWRTALYVFDPEQVRQVGRGARSPWSDGMNPVATYDWRARWPNVPKNLITPGGATQPRPIDSNISNTGFWDPQAQEILWVQPVSVGTSPRPTLNIFTVGAGTNPSAPTNLRIIR
jgi:hypothetical protein